RVRGALERSPGLLGALLPGACFERRSAERLGAGARAGPECARHWCGPSLPSAHAGSAGSRLASSTGRRGVSRRRGALPRAHGMDRQPELLEDSIMKHSLQLLVAASACAGLSTACAGSDRHTETPMATYTAAGEAAQLAQKNVALAEQVRAAAEQGPLGAAADEREPVVGIERELIVIEPQIEVVDEAEVDEEKVAEAESEDAASADEPTTEPLRSMEGMTAYVRRGGEEDPDGAGFHDQLTAA